MRGPFQGVDSDPDLYALRHPPVSWDLPATGIGRRPHWMTHYGALQQTRGSGRAEPWWQAARGAAEVMAD